MIADLKIHAGLFVSGIIASITLQSVGTVIGITGGLAGYVALRRVGRIVDPLEKFIVAQSVDVKQHKAAIEEHDAAIQEIIPPKRPRKR